MLKKVAGGPEGREVQPPVAQQPQPDLADYLRFVDTFFEATGTRKQNAFAASPLRPHVKHYVELMHRNGVLMIKEGMPSMTPSMGEESVFLYWPKLHRSPAEFSVRVMLDGSHRVDIDGCPTPSDNENLVAKLRCLESGEPFSYFHFDKTNVI